MQATTKLLRQVVAQQALPLAPNALCASLISATSRLQPFRWSNAHYSAAAAAKQQGDKQQQDPAAAESQQQQQQQQQQQEASSSSSTASEEQAATDSSSGFDFSKLKDRFSGSSSSSSSGGGGGSSSDDVGKEPLQQRAAKLWATLRREVADAVLPRQETISITRAYEGPTYQGSDAPYTGTTALAAVQQQDTWHSKLMSELYEKFGHHPIFAKFRKVDLTANPVYQKGAELAEDIREKYETSDHPAVHKVEDVKEKLFGMSETASAMAIIRGRDPRFDMSRLLEGVKYDAPNVVKAFLTHDLPTLKQHCGPELQEKLAGIFKHFESQDLYEDPTILFTGDPELVELKLVEGEPLVVVQFACQQLKCTRDKFGNVMDGDPNSIQKVFYFWGLQQEGRPTILPNGKLLPPRWVIKDMMWQSLMMLA